MDDDGSVIAGVILGLYNSTSTEPNKAGERVTNDGRVTDKRTFICPKCDRGWEFVLHSAGSGSYGGCVLYSKNITRYRKQRSRNCIPRRCCKEKGRYIKYAGSYGIKRIGLIFWCNWI